MNPERDCESTEEWRRIPETSGNYLVSSLGRIKSVERKIVRSNGWPQTTRERILRLSFDDCGYPMARVDGKTFKVHRGVALAFLGERPDGAVIRHLDGNPKNCTLCNLAYGSASENVMDGYAYAGRIKKNQKLTLKSAAEIKEKIKNGVRSVEIAKEYGISQQSVCDIKHERIYGHLSCGGTS